jgi:hypothetical protein
MQEHQQQRAADFGRQAGRRAVGSRAAAGLAGEQRCSWLCKNLHMQPLLAAACCLRPR